MYTELNPSWTETGPFYLEGRVDLVGYMDKVIDGITYQDPVPATIQFFRWGDSSNSCEGSSTIWFDDITDIEDVKPLLKMNCMLYGPESSNRYVPIRYKDTNKVGVIATGFDTEACDTIFQDVGQVTWSETYGMEPEPHRTEPPPPPSRETPSPPPSETPPPLDLQTKYPSTPIG